VRTTLTTTDTIYYFNTQTQTWEKASALSPTVFSQVTYDTLYSWFAPGVGEVLQNRRNLSVLSADTATDPGDSTRSFTLRYVDHMAVGDTTQDTTDTTDTTTARLDARTLEALLYPQPSNGAFTLLLGELPRASELELQLLDMQGRRVWRRKSALRTEVQVQLPALPAGRYSLYLKAGQRKAVLPVLLH